MKKIKVLLFITLSLICLSSIAYAEWQIQFDAEADRVMYMGGDTLRGNFATKKQCLDYWRSRPYFEQHHSSCVGYDSPKQGSGGGTTFGWGGGNINTEAGAKQFLLGNMLGAILGNALNPPPQQDDIQAQQKQAAIKKEKERKAGIARLKELQRQVDLQRVEEQRQKEEQGRKAFAKLDKVGSQGSLSMESVSGDSLGAFSRGNLDLQTNELQPIGTGRYDTSSLSSQKRLLCATYFSQAALAAANSGEDVRAKYLNQQAQKVMSGQMIDRECQFPTLPSVPEVPKPVKAQSASNQKTAAYYEGLIKTVHQEAKKLKDIKTKLKETDKKITQAKEKRKKAEQKIAEAQKSAAMARKSQEKQQADDLLASAQALLRESRDEVKAAAADKQALSRQKEDIITRLKEVQRKIQPKTETK